MSSLAALVNCVYSLTRTTVLHWSSNLEQDPELLYLSINTIRHDMTQCNLHHQPLYYACNKVRSGHGAQQSWANVAQSKS